MTHWKSRKLFTLGLVLALGGGIGLSAQAPAGAPAPAPAGSAKENVFIFKQAPDVMFTQALEAPVGGPVFDQTVTFISAIDPGGGSTIKGAPYSANAVTETVQTLADGNRIVKKVSSYIARDLEGRTRRDQNLVGLGPWEPANAGASVSFIMDPVAKVQYILEHETRTARELPFVGEGPRKAMVASRVVGAGSGAPFNIAMPAPMVGTAGIAVGDTPLGTEARTESLGTRSIEGVEAQGMRTTTTIPAGAIGNERPIDRVSETWYAPSLQLQVMSRNSDPRFGETIYRLENLSLLEPIPTSFEVPRDYTIAHAGDAPSPQVIRKAIGPLK